MDELKLIEQTKTTLLEMARLTGNPSATPDPVTVLALKGRLIGFATLIGEHLAQKAKAKVSTHNRRKLAHADQYRKIRETGKGSGDAEKDAMLAIGEELTMEEDAIEEHDLLRTYLQTIHAALQHGQQVVSFYKNQESKQ